MPDRLDERECDTPSACVCVFKDDSRYKLQNYGEKNHHDKFMFITFQPLIQAWHVRTHALHKHVISLLRILRRKQKFTDHADLLWHLI